LETYKVDEVTSDKFYQTPKDLFNNPCYRYALTSDAKLVYSLLRDRMELSRTNNWVNDKGEIFLLYTKENLAEMLGVTETTVYRAFKILETCELIRQERQGLNKPNKIYIGKTNFTFSIASKPELSRICKICRSGCVKNEGQDLQNIKGNETEYSETDFNETDSLYIVPNNDVFIDFYLRAFKHYFNADHVRVSRENLIYIQRTIEIFHDRDIELDEWQEKVVEHLENLPDSNNGSIVAFLKASFRYFEIDPERAIG